MSDARQVNILLAQILLHIVKSYSHTSLVPFPNMLDSKISAQKVYKLKGRYASPDKLD